MVAVAEEGLRADLDLSRIAAHRLAVAQQQSRLVTKVDGSPVWFQPSARSATIRRPRLALATEPDGRATGVSGAGS